MFCAHEARAQGAKDQEALTLAKQAIDEHYLAMNMEEAAATLERALEVCKTECSPKALAVIHRNLAVVYIAGMNKQAEGEREMTLALAADPTLQLNPDIATPEVKAAYAKAGGKPGAGSSVGPVLLKEDESNAAAAPEDASTSTSTSKDELQATEDPSGGAARSNHWLSLSVQKDFFIHRETLGVCASQTTTGSRSYYCKNSVGQTWGFHGEEGIDPSPGSNSVKTGIAPSTTRVMAGYDYAISDNLMAGARLGLAFGGAVHDELANEKPFMPYHVELRGQYFLGGAPLASAGFRPYLGAGAGLGQFDSFVQVEFFGVSDPGPDGAKYTLNAWRRAGNMFVLLALGAEYAFTPRAALYVEFQGLQLFGQAANVLALRAGFRYGL